MQIAGSSDFYIVHVYILDLVSGEWTSIPTDGSVGRDNFFCGLTRGGTEIVVAGGFNFDPLREVRADWNRDEDSNLEVAAYSCQG